MTDWEHEANAMLRSLGDSYQQGGISRATYRERRRRVLAALRQRHEATERNPIHVDGHRAAVAGAVLRAGPTPQDAPPSRRRLIALVVCAALMGAAVAVGARWI